MIEIKVPDKSSTVIKRIQAAQKTGCISLDNIGLNLFPNEVVKIDELRFDTQKWWEINPITKIDLSNNQIKEIPEDIHVLKEIITFRMQNNKLETLPQSLFTIPTLKSIDCTHNQIRMLPPNFVESTSLVELILKDNKIELLPVSFGKLLNLEILDISKNKLTKLRLFERDLPRLKRLDLSENLIDDLDENMTHLSQLDTIILSKNKLSKLPEGVFRGMKNLKTLDLKENKLTSFSDFPASDKLDSVFLSYNQIRYIEQYQNCPKLTVLDIKNNKCDKLNSDIACLKELKTLDLSNNDFSDIPSEIGYMQKLVRISLEGNPLKCIRSSVRSAGTEGLKKYLRERVDTEQAKSEIIKEYTSVSKIDVWDQMIKDFLIEGKNLIINDRQLTDIHDKFCQLNLITLDLSKNFISTINPNLPNLMKLQKLRLNNNKLEYFPAEILIQFPCLEELELRGNKLRGLLNEISPKYYPEVLQTLRVIDLSQNQLEILPQFITFLPRLRVCALAFNKLTSVDDLFNENLQSLEILDISNNKIKNLGENIAYLERLEHLNLEYNDISNIPSVIGFLTSIKNLNVYGNPIKNIRNDIIGKGSKQILEYLQTRHPGQFVPPKKQKQQNEMHIEVPLRQEEDPYFEIKNYKITQINPHSGPPSQTASGRNSISKELNYQANNYQNRVFGQNLDQIRDKEALKEVELLDKKIIQLENDLRDNFALSTNQINAKKREINLLRSEKSKLIQRLNEQN